MNTKGNRNRIILIAGIMAVMVTALFLVVNITPLFMMAYAFALIGIAAFCFGNLYLQYDTYLRKVADALRYSDPMSHSSPAVYEEQIQRKIEAIGDGEEISKKCDELLRLIADRNSRVKIMK